MAMVPAAMATLIVNQLKTLNPEIASQPGAEAKLLASWTAIATGMITHITSAAVINTNDTIISNGSTTSGPPSGPFPIVSLAGMGTGVGTIS